MMDHPLQLLTTKQHNRGYTLLEMMLVLTIISLMAAQLFLTFKPLHISDDIHFENNYLLHQIKSISTKSTNTLETKNSNVDKLSFNSFGNVNSGQTITFDGFKMVIQLGMGRYDKR